MSGIINLFFSVFNGIDSLLATIGLPAVVRLFIWGVLSGVLSTWFYILASQQEALRSKKQDLKALRARIAAAQDAEFEEVMRLSMINLKQSLLLLKMVLWPTVVSALSVLVIILWLSAFYTYQLPTGQTLAFEFVPPNAQVMVEPSMIISQSEGDLLEVQVDQAASLEFLDEEGPIYKGAPLAPPTGSVHPWRWWNIILGNEAGYLRANSDLQEIRFHFEPLEVLSGVPQPIRNWQFPYIVSLMVTAIFLRVRLKIE